MDFTTQLAVSSNDEIGELSQNINHLSEQLSKHISHLEKEIEREKALENTRKEFIANVSHELKTPLSVVKSCISILQDGISPQKKDYYLQAVDNETHKMEQLIADMLELAKLSSGTYEMKMSHFEPVPIIEALVEKLSLDIVQKNLQVEISTKPLTVLGNVNYIEQVLLNFLTNAIRYTPTEERILIVLSEESSRAKFSIENKGAHIPKEQLEKLWDQFYRLDGHRNRTSGGTGLGLTITQNILKLHRAQYGVQNTEDGVVFYFYLNLAKEASEI